jgi:hypothetical protein
LKIPRHNIRLSSVAAALRDLLGVGVFAVLLRDLAPKEFERLREKRATPYEILVAVVDEVSKLFPLDTYTLDAIYNNAYEVDDYDDDGAHHDVDAPPDDPDLRAARDIEFYGIPIQAFGFNLGNGEHRSPATALLLLAAGVDAEIWGRDFIERVERDCAAILAPFGVLPLQSPGRRSRRGALIFNLQSPNLLPAPPGRRWLSAWSGVADALRWVSSSTGYDFLDRDEDQVNWEYPMPPWDMDEIRSLAGQWKEAKPILDRARALIAYVDADPPARLPILRGLLSGDPASIRAATRRIPSPHERMAGDEVEP